MYCRVCVCSTVLMVWINTFIAESLKSKLPAGYCNACARCAPFSWCHRGGVCTDGLGPPSLLASIFRAQASKAQGPIDSLRIIIILFILFLFQSSGGFGGLNVLKNYWKLAHTLESVAIRTPQRLGPRRGTGALRRPLEHSQKSWCFSHTYLHVFIWNSVHI